MGWRVSLIYPDGEIINIPHIVNDSYEFMPARMVVSYTFAEVFPFHELHGKLAKATCETLRMAVKKLGMRPSAEPWKAEPGNVGHVCATLLTWAEQQPSGVWQVRLP